MNLLLTIASEQRAFCVKDKSLTDQHPEAHSEKIYGVKIPACEIALPKDYSQGHHDQQPAVKMPA
jgi:hypothetical protein